MKKTNQKGITLVALVITIIILLILAAVGITQGTRIIKDAYLQTLNTNMLLVQGKAKMIYEHNLFNAEEQPLIGKNLSEEIEDEEIKAQIDYLKSQENIIQKNSEHEEGQAYSDYYIWTQNELNEVELTSITLDEGFFIVNYITEEVIYSEGFEYTDNNKYYKLSDTINLR